MQLSSRAHRAQVAAARLHPPGRTSAGARVSSMSSPAPTPQAVRLTRHAAEQYQLRVKPGLDLDTAPTQLERLRLTGQVSAAAPEWLTTAEPARYYLLLGDAVALPLAPQGEGWVATTCLTQGTLTPPRRPAEAARP